MSFLWADAVVLSDAVTSRLIDEAHESWGEQEPVTAEPHRWYPLCYCLLISRT